MINRKGGTTVALFVESTNNGGLCVYIKKEKGMRWVHAFGGLL